MNRVHASVFSILFVFPLLLGCGSKEENVIHSSKEDRLEYMRKLDNIQETIEAEQTEDKALR